MTEAGLGAHAQIVDVHDGDTVTVEVRFRVPVRIRNLWAPELKEKGGKESQEALQQLLPLASPCIVFVPSKNPLLLMDAVSLGRIIGDVYNADGINVAEKMVAEGFGTAKKGHIA
jgi:endonuclease YncB( thermonuclease family)